MIYSIPLKMLKKLVNNFKSNKQYVGTAVISVEINFVLCEGRTLFQILIFETVNFKLSLKKYLSVQFSM
jgi:hypothetical protein